MNNFVIYLIVRFIYRIKEFFVHWYIDGFYFVYHSAAKLLRQLDAKLAFAVNLRHFGEPLYQDYTIVGRILGPIFRTGRVVFAAGIYSFIILFAFSVYLGWSLILPLCLLWSSILKNPG